jgi:hypothetical protein
MRDRPNGADLLAIARDTYLDEVLPHVPKEKRYAGLMVANAMAIARREIESGDEHLVQELVRLAGIYREEPPSVSDTTTLVRELERLNRRLAADIRTGEFDSAGPHRDAVRRHLEETTIQKLRENNPKHLEVEGLG